MLRESALAFSLFFLLMGLPTAQAQQQESSSSSSATELSELETIQSLSSPLPKKASSFKKREVRWDIEYAGMFEGEGQDDVFAVMTSLGLSLQFNFTENVQLKLAPGATFYSARAQNRFDSDNFEDRITAREAYLQFRFSPLFTAGFGSYSQSFLSQPQLISGGRSFPALYIKSEHQFDAFKIFLQAEEAIPTSYTYSAFSQEKEALPGLRALRVGSEVDLSQDLQAHLAVGTLNWRNLPSRVAFNSQRRGNTPSGEEFEASSRFMTGFSTQFIELGMTSCKDCTWSLEATYRRARNVQAPSDSADSQMYGAGIRHRGRQIKTHVSLNSFFAESDVTPAIYAQSSLGNTNRQGTMAEVEVEIPRFEAKVKGQWIQANPLTASPYQNDLNSIYLGVETDGTFL